MRGADLGLAAPRGPTRTLAQREAILAFLEHIGAPQGAQEPWRRVVAIGDDPDWFRKRHVELDASYRARYRDNPILRR